MKKIIIFFNQLLFKLRSRPLESPHLFNKILIVSNTALGDTLLSTPVLKTIKKSFPNTYIIFMVNKTLYPLFEEYEYADQVIAYNKSFLGIIKHVWFLKREKIDSIFFLHSNGPQDLFMALLSNIPSIYKAMNYPHNVSSEFLAIIQNKVDRDKHQHIIEHRLDTIRHLNPAHIDTTIDLPKKFYTTLHKKNNEFVLGIQLGAADIYKMWPVENFSQLSNQLLLSYPTMKIVLLGIQKEEILADQVFALSTDKERIINYCGTTRIEELPDTINSLDLLLSNDTGTLHLAIALKKNTVSLFSPTDSTIFGPYQDHQLHTVIQKDGSFMNQYPTKKRNQDAMKLITVDEVYQATIEQINRIHPCVES